MEEFRLLRQSKRLVKPTGGHHKFPYEHRTRRGSEIPVEQRGVRIPTPGKMAALGGHELDPLKPLLEEIIRRQTHSIEQRKIPLEALATRDDRAIESDGRGVCHRPSDLGPESMKCELHLKFGWLPHVIGIKERNELASGLADPVIPRGTNSSVPLPDVPHRLWEGGTNLGGVIC